MTTVKIKQTPECEECNQYMSLDESIQVYSCEDCYSGCSCFQSAPCSFCIACIPVDVWENEKELQLRNHPESGPSAAMAATPVRPKFTVHCQGDWYSDLENL